MLDVYERFENTQEAAEHIREEENRKENKRKHPVSSRRTESNWDKHFEKKDSTNKKDDNAQIIAKSPSSPKNRNDDGVNYEDNSADVDVHTRKRRRVGTTLEEDGSSTSSENESCYRNQEKNDYNRNEPKQNNQCIDSNGRCLCQNLRVDMETLLSDFKKSLLNEIEKKVVSVVAAAVENRFLRPVAVEQNELNQSYFFPISSEGDFKSFLDDLEDPEFFNIQVSLFN